MADRWRQGRSVGRTLYVGDKLVGVVDTPEIAARIVAAMNLDLGPLPIAPITCTCPSGDGSLRWPCPVHPPASV